MPVGYIDTCVISGVIRQDIDQTELQALIRLLECYKAKVIDLVTSEISKDEIDNIPLQYRLPQSAIYLLLRDVPAAEPVSTSTLPMSLPHSLGTHVDPVYTYLKGVLPGEKDVLHVFQAIKSCMDYFVTVDFKTILKKKKPIERLYPIRLLSPKQLVQHLNL